MSNSKLSNKAAKIKMEDTVQKVMDMLEEEDGRSFEEKKQEVIAYLKEQEDVLLAERLLKAAINDDTGRNIKEKFWSAGNVTEEVSGVCLRQVRESDRDFFIALQEETCIMKSMLKEDGYRLMLWNEHIQDKSMMFTIEVNGRYAGYCGINDLSKENWEIAIELLKDFHNKRVGYNAISIMLSEIKNRLGRDEFRVKIDADNYASQRLFEKLGATPYGIAEHILHKEEDIIKCEEENLDAIDDKIEAVAKKFGVEPRKLISHVLEYELKWKNIYE